MRWVGGGVGGRRGGAVRGMSGPKEGGHKGEKGAGVVFSLPFSSQTLG